MFTLRMMVNGDAMTNHEATVITHDAVAGVTVVTCDHWNDGGGRVMTTHERELDVGMTFASAESWLQSLPEYEEVPDESAELVAEIAAMLTDEQAEQVPQAYPQWSAGTSYAVGDRVRDTLLYRCVQAHTSQGGWEPHVTHALWVRTSTDEWPEWVQPTGAHDAYAMGDKVSHDGSHWVSTVDSNVWEPSVYGWESA